MSESFFDAASPPHFLELASTVPAIRDLRLVLVETPGEGMELVSLTHRCVVAAGTASAWAAASPAS